MHSSSNVTCWFRISATLCGTLISGSGTTPVLRDQPPLRWPYHWQELHALLHRRPEPLPGLSNTAQTQTVHLVGLRRSLVSPSSNHSSAPRGISRASSVDIKARNV